MRLSRFDYEYSPAGTITRWNQRLGTVRERDGFFAYDRTDQLLGAIIRDPTSSAIVKSFGYAYDPAGNRLTEQIDSAITGATFNNLNQLTSRGGAGKVLRRHDR